jgi:hypothetical protein
MSGAGTVSRSAADAAPSPTMAACYFCGDTPAVVYCRADAAGLCLPCDRHVHGANTVSSRHARAPLCATCRDAGASVRRGGAARFLCSDCDFDECRRGGEPVMHDRGTVEGYTGCPSVGELAVILGVVVGEKVAADEGWRPVWEEPGVLTLDDVIVPTTSCHDLQPLLTSPAPKVSYQRHHHCKSAAVQLLFTVRQRLKKDPDIFFCILCARTGALRPAGSWTGRFSGSSVSLPSRRWRLRMSKRSRPVICCLHGHL